MHRLMTRAGRLKGRVMDLASDRGGSINVMFALALLPTIGLVGLGVDYGMAISSKTRLDNAADAAALAGVVTAKEYIAANAKQSDVTTAGLTAGRNQGTKAFNINAGKVPFATVSLTSLDVTRTGQTLTAKVTYTATVQNTFGKIFGLSTSIVTNTVTASADLAGYLDFYLMVDVSGSMGLPTTDADAALLASKSVEDQGNCQFACHFPNRKGWNLAAGKIQLRSDAVNNAVCALLNRASTPIVPNQYRIGIYPFINRLATLAPLSDTTSSLASLRTAAQCDKTWPLAFTNLLDTGSTQLYTNNDPTTGTGSGGTHFEKALPQMKSTIQPYGNGSSSSNSKPFVFLITDGMQNSQSYTAYQDKKTFSGNPSKFAGYRYADWDGSQPAQIDPAKCTELKDAGATISVLYIPYRPVKDYSKDSYIIWENSRVNGFSPTLAEPLRKCASSGLFFTANTQADITASLGAMFDQALKVARITE
ncbi:TadE/TadG family type IV pilus assembly protein [Methylobacterium sp. R2-1]|uniref:TadE/TadG family type IV pilus assembly protein n=1 Tax=Methylobacterium sp. R2-1 TaxID=2587064 RepID=UPI00160E4D60|nr:pilus assembly protein TadG-related protein [Methylobacterium sp. R2-1]MBB2963238.1 Flp pilus assembly protein TadG [Methylobacterium sp. R2-1]